MIQRWPPKRHFLGLLLSGMLVGPGRVLVTPEVILLSCAIRDNFKLQTVDTPPDSLLPFRNVTVPCAIAVGLMSSVTNVINRFRLSSCKACFQSAISPTSRII